MKCRLYLNYVNILLGRGKEKFNTKTVEWNFKIFQTEGISLFTKDSAKYFS